ncbi:unnamed protein product, partial [Phaeothamnion confervicola]
DSIVQIWRDAASPKIIRLEGFAGVGKTGLAGLVKARVNGVHVAGDEFVSPFDVPRSYRERMRQSEFNAAIEKAVSSKRAVILDAVCLDEVAPIATWGRGFVVYIKRLSFNKEDPIWHDGISLEREAPIKEAHRSIHLYHNRVKPHETANLIIELPDE